MHYRFAHTTSELARAGYEGSTWLGRHEIYRCHFLLHTAAQNLRTCTHRMYVRKNTVQVVQLQDVHVLDFALQGSRGITYVPRITMVAKKLLSFEFSPTSPHVTRPRRGRPPTIFTTINFSTNPDDKFNLLSRNINLNAYSYLSVIVYYWLFSIATRALGGITPECFRKSIHIILCNT